MESINQPIIPGLPDDLGLRCLAMLPHGYHGVMETVSKRWRDVLRSEEYASYKARQGWCGDWLFVLTWRWEDQWIAYDPEADRWHPLPPIPSPHWHPSRPMSGLPVMYGTKMHVLGCHCVCNKFIVIGGIYNCGLGSRMHCPLLSNEMFQFDPFKKEWSRVTSMRTSRSSFASCAMNGKIYVAGGSSLESPSPKPRRIRKIPIGTKEYPSPKVLDLAEVYDPLTDKWEDLPPMPVPVIRCEGIAYKGKFHVINRHLIQVFDPLSRSWQVKHENWSPSLDQVAVAVVDDEVYSINTSGTLERRDAEEDEWHIVEEAPPLYDSNGSQLYGHPNYGLASLGHELSVMGGRAFRTKRLVGLVYLDRVRVCDPRCLPLNWREARPMCLNASGFIMASASLKQQ